jgi:hypothetical protein
MRIHRKSAESINISWFFFYSALCIPIKFFHVLMAGHVLQSGHVIRKPHLIAKYLNEALNLISFSLQACIISHISQTCCLLHVKVQLVN